LGIGVAIVGSSAERAELRNGTTLLVQLTERRIWAVLGLGSRRCPSTSMEIGSLCFWLAIKRRGYLLLGKR
jgi:hypothetical protein